MNMDGSSWRAKAPSDLRKNRGMLSNSAAPLTLIFKWETTTPVFEVEHNFHHQQITISSSHNELADPGIVVHKNVGFGF